MGFINQPITRGPHIVWYLGQIPYSSADPLASCPQWVGFVGKIFAGTIDFHMKKAHGTFRLAILFPEKTNPMTPEMRKPSLWTQTAPEKVLTVTLQIIP